jgi:hypothetical protein
VVGDDFNVDFNRNTAHTHLMKVFLDDKRLLCADTLAGCDADFTYHILMTRFIVH